MSIWTDELTGILVTKHNLHYSSLPLAKGRFDEHRQCLVLRYGANCHGDSYLSLALMMSLTVQSLVHEIMLLRQMYMGGGGN